MYKYWRVSIGGCNPYRESLVVNYMTMHDVVGGPNILSGGEPYTNVLPNSKLNVGLIDNADEVSLGAFIGVTSADGNYSLGRAMYGYQFASPVNIVTIYMRLKATYKLYDIFVQASNDGVHWVNKAFYRNKTFNANTLTEIYVTDNYVDEVKFSVMNRYMLLTPPHYFPEISNKCLVDKFKYKQHYGPYRIYGTTTSEGDRVPRQAYLMNTMSGEIVEGQWTGDNGEFEFTNLKKMNYTVIGVDRSIEQNSVIFSHIEPAE